MSDWQNLADEVKAEARHCGPACGVLRMLKDEIPKEAHEWVLRVIGDQSVPATAIRRALARRIGTDKTPSAYAISRHRRGDCTCEREG